RGSRGSAAARCDKQARRCSKSGLSAFTTGREVSAMASHALRSVSEHHQTAHLPVTHSGRFCARPGPVSEGKRFSLGPRPAIIGATSGGRSEVSPMENRRTSPENVPLGDRTIDAASTFELLELAKAGSSPAVNALFTRYLPPLRRWARGRLPRFARDMLDTDDLVQETVFQTLRRVQSFEPQHEGALQAYLQQAVVNRIRDEVRRAARHPASEDLQDDAFVDDAASPLDE